MEAEFAARSVAQELEAGAFRPRRARPPALVRDDRPVGLRQDHRHPESGLNCRPARRGKVRGVGGTRNCDWWMTNEAILLDTAGRWSTDEDDRDEWLAFLDILKRTGPRSRSTGSWWRSAATDLTGTEEIARLARKLRERIDEVTGRWTWSSPST